MKTIRLLLLVLALALPGLAQLVPTVAIQDPVTHAIVSVSSSGGIGVSGVGNASGATGQQSVTGSAVALASAAAKQVCINALSGNAISIFIGFSSGATTSTGFELKAGAGVCLPLSNTNLLFVVAATTGAGVSWIATN